MPETFGDRLRQKRELRGVGLTAIAEDTKISVGLLDALEHDDLSHWPAGIFRRSFVRSYARAIGLDPEVTVREFCEAHPDPIPDPEPGDIERMLADTAPREESNGGVRSRLGLMFHALATSRNSTETPGFGRLGAAAPPPRSSATPSTRATESVREPTHPPVEFTTRIDLTVLAKLCTNLAAAQTIEDALGTVDAVAEMIGTVGVIAWKARADTARLVPVAACGYPPSLLARVPEVPCDADNATAAAFRSSETCVVASTDRTNGAITVPIVGTAGCIGVLAIEVNAGIERDQQVQAIVAIVAAQLSGVLAQGRVALGDRKLA
jgi:hypothetical protein